MGTRIRRLTIPMIVGALIVSWWAVGIAWSFAEWRQAVVTREQDLARLTITVEEQMLRLLNLTETAMLAGIRWVDGHPQAFAPGDPEFEALVGDLVRLADQSIAFALADRAGRLFPIPASAAALPGRIGGPGGIVIAGAPGPGGLRIGDPATAPGGGRRVIPMIRELGGQGEMRHLVAMVDLEGLARSFEAQREKPGGSITLLRSDGMTLFRAPAIEGAIGRSIAAAPDFVEHLGAVERGQYRVRGAYDGVDRLVSHARMKTYPLIVAVTASMDDALRPWREQVLRVAALILLASAFAAAVTRRFLRVEEAARRELTESEERFRSLTEMSSDFYWESDAEHRLTQRTETAREASEGVLRRSPSIGKRRWEIPYLAPDEAGWAAHRAMLDARQPFRDFEISRLRVNGEVHHISVSGNPVFDADGRFRGYRGVGTDITERKRAEERLQLAARVFTHSREAIMITAADGTIIEVNDAFTQITGYSRAEAIGANPRILRSGRQEPAFYEAMWRELMERGHWSGEIWNRRKSGEIYAELITVSAVRDAQGAIQQFVALFSDITALKAHQGELERIAHHDALTGLPNRVLLADRLRQAIAQAERRGNAVAVAYLDLDGFKAINDRHGHDCGDRLLVALAGRMKQALREGDTLSRLGGDEFVAVLLDLPEVAASVPMIMRLLAAAARPVHVAGHDLVVSASVGVTCFPQAEDVDADQLLRQADQAMYQAKLAGKNRYHLFDAEQDRNVRGHHESIERIRQGLARNEFELHYQPKVNMRSGAVVGAEALIRWQHPERGLLLPDQFLPVIENHALGVELGDRVIAGALAQLDRWQDAGPRIPVSVNVSARHLQAPDFVARLRSHLAARPALPPGSLELEILETSALEDLEQVSAIIEACRDLGVGFALDDFGTGYSSLTYLKRLAVVALKIDRSFVRGLIDDPDDMAILDGVLGLAAVFGRQVIAEGVETAEHGERLLQLGCDLGQGEGIAAPMPADAFAAWAAGWRPAPRWSACPRARRRDLPFLYASAEHRAWVRRLAVGVAGDGALPAGIEAPPCRFGRWLASPGGRELAAGAELAAILASHERLHAAGERLAAESGAGTIAGAAARVAELEALRADFDAAVTARILAHAQAGNGAGAASGI